MKNNEIANTQRLDALFERIASLIEQGRRLVCNTVNIVETRTRYEVGRYIYEDEQQGERAAYGQQVLRNLSARLIASYGPDWTYDTLKRCRFFYLAYSNSTQAPRFTHTWSHYLVLMRIENTDERSFYEIEATEQQWSVKQLKRQVGSSLYEQLALSRDKEEVMRLSREGQTIEKPTDVLKNPLTLEFLGLKPDATYTESKLENAIISRMQQFLLEMGKGFLFEARQKRFTFEERNFYVDLVFYNRLLQCYVLIDLKCDDLTHQDLGQMQMYVNYYDRYVRQDFEKPTIGILLCETASQPMVELPAPQSELAQEILKDPYAPS
ncbi:MAG: DUF1016 family protein [Bacteroidales bacterium]|nr:DUF1016 family protein [Bacteroidales bacterium]